MNDLIADVETHGHFVRRGESGYDGAQQAWQLTADLRPAAVAHPTNAEEVDLPAAATDRLLAVAGPDGGSPLVIPLELRRIRTRVDPTALFQAGHPIPVS